MRQRADRSRQNGERASWRDRSRTRHRGFGRLRSEQYLRKPARCHWITVSGFTKTTTSDHLAHSLRNVTQNSRSAPVTRPRRPVWARTASCCRRARFSITRSAREWSAARKEPKRSRTRRSMRLVRITAIRERQQVSLRRVLASHRLLSSSRSRGDLSQADIGVDCLFNEEGYVFFEQQSLTM